MLEQYIDKDSPETLRSLNILCVRLVFCLYAEDAGLFNSRTAFHDYLVKYGATDFRRALMDLFCCLIRLFLNATRIWSRTLLPSHT